jgi:hypothetical protein
MAGHSPRQGRGMTPDRVIQSQRTMPSCANLDQPDRRLASSLAVFGEGKRDRQSRRDRNAIYADLTAVYGLVAWWAAGGGRDVDQARRALRLCRLEVTDREDPFAAIIRCTADPAKADKRIKSKWALMRYAAMYKLDSEALDRFVRRKGGINACAARFTRWIGRRTRSERRAVTKSMGCWGMFVELRLRCNHDAHESPLLRSQGIIKPGNNLEAAWLGRHAPITLVSP